jgi:Fe-S-cluster containining protein
VTGSDIIKIAAVLGLGPEDMLKALDFYIVNDGGTVPVGLERISSVATERGLAYMALKKMENGDCVFLKDDLCMIHPVRPLVCKSFPFVFTESKGQIAWGLTAKKEICPGLGIGPQISESEIEELAETVLPGMRVYRDFVEEWNKNQTSPSVFNLIKTILSEPKFYDERL